MRHVGSSLNNERSSHGRTGQFYGDHLGQWIVRDQSGVSSRIGSVSKGQGAARFSGANPSKTILLARDLEIQIGSEIHHASGLALGGFARGNGDRDNLGFVAGNRVSETRSFGVFLVDLTNQERLPPARLQDGIVVVDFFLVRLDALFFLFALGFGSFRTLGFSAGLWFSFGFGFLFRGGHFDDLNHLGFFCFFFLLFFLFLLLLFAVIVHDVGLQIVHDLDCQFTNLRAANRLLNIIDINIDNGIGNDIMLYTCSDKCYR
mmetsp:Transcript_8501/g.20904  ORF Transcript_8501/g.20904 Transcript_8501/m.20904 type:complete len:261 (-) Transcript_8501:8-790(-)